MPGVGFARPHVNPDGGEHHPLADVFGTVDSGSNAGIGCHGTAQVPLYQGIIDGAFLTFWNTLACKEQLSSVKKGYLDAADCLHC